jgi:hypothetical protein
MDSIINIGLLEIEPPKFARAANEVEVKCAGASACISWRGGWCVKSLIIFSYSLHMSNSARVSSAVLNADRASVIA